MRKKFSTEAAVPSNPPSSTDVLHFPISRKTRHTTAVIAVTQSAIYAVSRSTVRSIFFIQGIYPFRKRYCIQAVIPNSVFFPSSTDRPTFFKRRTHGGTYRLYGNIRVCFVDYIIYVVYNKDIFLSYNVSQM